MTALTLFLTPTVAPTLARASISPGVWITSPPGLLLATARTEIAGYLSTLIYVYTVIIILYIVVQLLFAAGLRPPYSRTTDAILGFLRDITEPYLRIFRRMLPSFGGLDFSPIIAIIVLELLNSIVIQGLIHG